MDVKQDGVPKRGYHDTDAAYILPNDAKEHRRLEAQANGLEELMGGSPVLSQLDSSRNLRIVDVGCGTGAVTRFIARQYPSAHVFGIDLSAVPAQAEHLPHIEFIQDDIRKLMQGNDPRFAPGSLDFVFNRLLICGMVDWPGYVNEMASILKSGGRMEMQDLSYTLFKNGKVIDSEWQHVLQRHMVKKGLEYHCGEDLGSWMKDAGLVNVETREYHWTFGKWLTEERPETELLGKITAETMPELFSEMFGKMVGSAEDVDKVLRWKNECIETLRDGAGLEWKWLVTTGQKP